MTYEEKLDLVVKAIVEARKLTRKEQDTKLYLTSDNGLKPLNPNEIYSILLKLQDDERILSVQDIPTVIQKLFDISLEGSRDFFLLEIKNDFDSWYEKYIFEHKSRLENLDWINLLKALDVVLDINQQLQFVKSTTVLIPSLPQMVRFPLLFPSDSIGTRRIYQQYRWEGTQYLQTQGIIIEVKSINDDILAYGDIQIRVDLLKFEELYRQITDEWERRLKAKDTKQKDKTDGTNTQTKIDKSQKPQAITKLSYDPHKGVLDIEGKIVKFNKDSFRAKLLQLLLKDDKGHKREWSWDEVIEAIEGTKDKEATKENKNKFYPACDGLTKHIASKTGVNDLLIFNKSTVQINPKYS